MEDSKRGINNNKGLMAILCVLIVVVVGLVTGVIIVSLGGEDAPSEVSLVPEDLDLSIESEEDGGIDFVAVGRVYDEAMDASNILLQEDLNNIKVVKAIYDEIINNELLRTELPMYAVQFILAESEVLTKNGYHREALDGLLGRDISDLDLRDDYYGLSLAAYYRAIIKLAEELGEDDIEEEYRTKWENKDEIRIEFYE